MPAGQALRLPRWCLLMCCSELVQLLEAVAVDDLFQLAVVVVVNAGISATEFQQFAVLQRVGRPSVLSVAGMAIIIFVVLLFFSLISDAVAYFVSLYKEITLRAS